MRTFSTILAASSAALGVKWMSAIKGTLHPRESNSSFITFKLAASFLLGAVIRIISAPASIHLILCSTVAFVLSVSVVVIV